MRRYLSRRVSVSGRGIGALLAFCAGFTLILPASSALAAEPDSHQDLAPTGLRLSGGGGLLPQVLGQTAPVLFGPATAALSPGRLALRMQDDPDDLDLLPALVPLVDPNAPAPEGEGEGDSGMSFDAVDLSGSESEGSDTPNDAALLAEPVPPAPGASDQKPIVYQWWFWAVVGVVAAAGGGTVAALSGPEVILPEGTLGTMDRR